MEFLKFKRSILNLKNYNGTTTSMITITIRPEYSIHMIIAKLNEEIGKTDNIKDRTNADYVRTALVMAIEKLSTYAKRYPKTKENGLCIFSGVCLSADGKSKSISTLIEPYKPVDQLYRCDKCFHIDALLDQLDQDDNLYGFLIMNGDGYLIASVNGNKKEILYTTTVDLPKKHNKGGQSSLRFARIAEEKRTNYIRKVSEDFNRIFLQKKYISIIIAGNGSMKHKFISDGVIDYRLKNKIIKVIDVAYGSTNGLDQAISESSEIISHLKLVKESKEISEFFNEIKKSNNKIVYGREQIFNYLKDNLMEKIIINEDIDFTIYKNLDGEIFMFNDGSREDIHIIDYLIELNTSKKQDVVFISDKTPEGSMFCKGFDGIAGFSRYNIIDSSDYIIPVDDIKDVKIDNSIFEEELFI